MITALLIIVCLLAVVAFIQFGALIEMFHQLRQVRQHPDMFDTPTPLELGVSQGLAPSRIGLPIELDLAEHITNRLGIDITPAALVVRAGRLEQAQTVPSPRQLYTMLPAASARRVLVPKVSKAELGAHD